MSQTTGPLTGPTDDGPKDFTRARERITFRIDGDLFEAARALPGKTLTQFAKRFQDVGATPMAEQLDVILDALALVLLPDSFAQFSKRFGDLEDPIELTQASDVMIWLLEKYGLRPTQPSSNSAAGSQSPASGTNSTDAPQQPELSSATSSPLTGS